MAGWRFLLLMVLVLKLNGASTEQVECLDLQEICECNSTWAECEFKLDIKEIQTFTSYSIKSGHLETRGVSGETYFFDSSGNYKPSRNPDDPDRGPCYLTDVNDENDFLDAGCSIPMTVDGKTFAASIVVNGLAPGPTLVVYKNQTVVIDVVNNLLSEGTTIHWHGIHQFRTPWMDGVGYTTQPVIVAGASFRYIFKATPSGTHWYHSHVGTQRTVGLLGALAVREREEVLKQATEALGFGEFYDDSKHTVTISDIQRESSVEFDTLVRNNLGFFVDKPLDSVPTDSDVQYMPTIGPDGVDIGRQPYWSGLINGRGRHDANTFSHLTIYRVEYGNMYRFRVVGGQRSQPFKFSIDEHKLIAIATDADFIEPVEVDYIIIHTGERYDFLLNATGTEANYWIRAETLEVDTTLVSQFLGNSAEAVLHYEGEEEPDPLSLYANVNTSEPECNETQNCVALNCPFKEFPSKYGIKCVHIHNLRLLLPQTQDKLPLVQTNEECIDCLHFLNFGLVSTSFSSSINGHSHTLPVFPYQTYPGQHSKDTDDGKTCQKCTAQDYNGTSIPQDCFCTHVRTIASQYKHDRGNEQTIMMILSSIAYENETTPARLGAHPVHLHGHSFQVVHIEHGNTSNGKLVEPTLDIECNDALCTNPSWRNGPKNLSKYSDDGVRFSSKTVLKDTVIVPGGGYVVIAFLADNPGFWFMHCHIEGHQINGMAVIIREYPESVHNPPPNGINNCGDFTWTLEEFYQKLSEDASAQESSSDPCFWWKIGFRVCFTLLVIIVFINTLVACCCCYYRCCKHSRFQYTKL